MKHYSMLGMGLLISVLMTIPCFALNPPSDPQVSEATMFFNQLMEQTQNPLIARLAKENLERLQHPRQADEKSSGKQVEVALLSQANNSLAVPALINNRVMATFLVDTGATYTVITPQLAQKLGVQVTASTPRMAIITANGQISAPIVTLPSLAIGGLEVQNVQAIVQPLGNDALLAGLLGMNFFRNVDLTVKQNKLILTARAD